MKEAILKNIGAIGLIGYIGQNGFKTLGTGIFLNSEGYILTCNHVVESEDLSYIITSEYISNDFIELTKEVTAFQIIKEDYEEIIDLAIMKVDKNIHSDFSFNFPPPQFNLDYKPQIGDEVCFGGYPFCDLGILNLSFTSGIISSLLKENKDEDYIFLIQIDAMCHEGNSGGPLFLNETGEIIGIINSRFDPMLFEQRRRGFKIEIADRRIFERTNISYATWIKHAKEILNDIPP